MSETTPLKQWEFDHYSPEHWKEKREGGVDKTKSWVELSDIDDDCVQTITVYTDRKRAFKITAERDQWGTWILVNVGGETITIAQEDGTMSFVDALIAALTEFKSITDIDTKPPVEFNHEAT